MKAFLPLCLLLGACVTVPPPPFVPYNYYDYPPPRLSGRTYSPVSLRCIDGSNIFVHCNDSWWWAGPSKGWVPNGGGWYPWPRSVWPSKVCEIFPRWQSGPIPVVPYPD